MLPQGNRFGLVHRLAVPAATFAVGLAVGSALFPARSAQPIAGTASAAPAPPVATGATRYPVDVVRVVDGDTFEARVRVWPGIEIATKVRLRNIDAPEMRARCDQELAMARAARDALAAMLAEGPAAIGEVGFDKYGGRMLAAAYASRSGDVSTALLEAGLVRRYSGGRREPWCAGL
jgi:endonuclease YncB( thermonuclease family)